MKPGIYPPITDGGTSERTPLEVSWLSNPTVAVGELATDAPFVTAPLGEGIYVVWSDGPLWLNAGDDGGSVDPAVMSAGAAKAHDGPYSEWGVRADERIAVRRRPRTDGGTAATQFRIFKGA
ncbi:hypothetical protein [Methylobacterium indicum]|uniref:Uncharacterized protein n=1 Tax=Methylobacterium indicum TaxID=1775910 RepID=A0A8H8WSI4_9HYPH|nr:hypothetical protein [Methylobacterium indicum]BCM83591.1 hypothetical protein mvi_20520 [Methylobacterium indicum]